VAALLAARLAELLHALPALMNLILHAKLLLLTDVSK
jgi:hypothetical protein